MWEVLSRGPVEDCGDESTLTVPGGACSGPRSCAVMGSKKGAIAINRTGRARANPLKVPCGLARRFCMLTLLAVVLSYCTLTFDALCALCVARRYLREKIGK